MIDPELLAMLRCPASRQALEVAEGSLIAKLNEQIAAGTLSNQIGQKLESKLDGGLIRADGECLYPIVDDIPIMLADEAIVLK